MLTTRTGSFMEDSLKPPCCIIRNNTAVCDDSDCSVTVCFFRSSRGVKMEKKKPELDNRISKKYCPYCGNSMYVGFRCGNCHKVS
jgi:hypothetical protein